MSGLLFALAVLTSCSQEESVAGDAEGSAAANVVATQIDFNDQDCAGQGLPIALHITNNADKPTSMVFWSFSVYEKDHSTDLAEYTEIGAKMNDPSRRTDRIIQPGETFKVCSSAPQLLGNASPENLEYGVQLDPRF